MSTKESENTITIEIEPKNTLKNDHLAKVKILKNIAQSTTFIVVASIIGFVILIVILVTENRQMVLQDFQKFWIILAVLFDVSTVFCATATYITLRYSKFRKYPLILWSFIIWTDTFDTIWMLAKVNMSASGDFSFYLTPWSCTLSGAIDNFTQLSRSAAEMVLAISIFGFFFSNFGKKYWKFFPAVILGPAIVSAILPAAFGVIGYNGGWCSSLNIGWELATSLVPCNTFYLIMLILTISSVYFHYQVTSQNDEMKVGSQQMQRDFIIRSMIMMLTGGVMIIPYTVIKALAAAQYDITTLSSLMYFTAFAYPCSAIVECTQFFSSPVVKEIFTKSSKQRTQSL